MNKIELMKVLDDWNFWEKDLDTGISRADYTKKLHDLLTTNQVITISGPRRSGKSYIMRQFAKQLIENNVNKNNILIINFEDPRFSDLDVKLLEQIHKTYLEYLQPSGEIYIFLDEIQEVAKWEKWVRTMHELKKAHLIISGSNAKLLSQELSTVLTGRHVDLLVFPLSFKEYLSFNNIRINGERDILRQEIIIKGLLRRYLEEGAYPEVVLSKKVQEILLSYFDDILNKDLVHRYKIRKSEKMKSLSKFFLTQTASLITYNSASKFLELTADTVEKYASYLETAYLLFFMKRFSFKVKEQEKSPRKVYAVDTGLANTIGFRFSENWGRIAENVVFLELRRKQAQDPNIELYFWKDIHHFEVDFVIKHKLQMHGLIQVSWEIAEQKTKEREIRGLLKCMKEFGISQSLIITEDLQKEEKINGKKIEYLPLWKWLLL